MSEWGSVGVNGNLGVGTCGDESEAERVSGIEMLKHGRLESGQTGGRSSLTLFPGDPGGPGSPEAPGGPCGDYNTRRELANTGWARLRFSVPLTQRQLYPNITQHRPSAASSLKLLTFMVRPQRGRAGTPTGALGLA